MTLDKASSLVSRIFFSLSFVLLIGATLERFANGLGYTVVKRTFSPGRLLEFAVILLIFVIALLLRQTRDALRKA